MTEYLGQQRWTPLNAIASEGARQGGTARVLRARNVAGEVVAIKEAMIKTGPWLHAERVLLQQIASEQPDTARWLIPVLDHGLTEDHRPWMALPWYEYNLKGWIHYEQPPIEEILQALVLAVDAVRRLNEASQNPARLYLHRDVKPENFLVGPGPPLRVVLADLGGAKEGRVTSAEPFPGSWTPGFSPMEQTLGLDSFDRSVDVHGLAATIYDALTGSPPFDAHRRDDLLTDAGRELRRLHRRARRSPEEQAQYDVLRQDPLEVYLRDTQVEALPEAARRRLVDHLESRLTRRVGDPREVAERAAAPLLAALTSSLALLPQHRNGEPRRLADACERARETIEGELLEEARVHRHATIIAEPGPAAAPIGQPPAAETLPLRPLQRGAPREDVPPKRAYLGLFLGLVAGAVALLLLGVFVFRRAVPPEPVAASSVFLEPPAAPLEPPATAPVVSPAVETPRVPPTVAPILEEKSEPVKPAPVEPAPVAPTKLTPEPVPSAAGVTMVWACSGDLDARFQKDGGAGVNMPLKGLFRPGAHVVEMSCVGENRRFTADITARSEGVEVLVQDGVASFRQVVSDGALVKVCYRSASRELAWGRC